MESTESSVPKRGEIWLTAFGAGRPGESSKTRPAVVLSVASQLAGTSRGLLVVVPLSSSMTETKTRPSVLSGPENGLMADSVLISC